MDQKFPSKFDTPDQSPGFLLWQVTCHWQRLQREALAKVKLTHVQFVLLACTSWLEHQKEKVTQIRLASQAGTDPMMTSQVVRTLEKKGLVSRIKDAADSRAMVLSTTEKGKDLAKMALQIVEEVDKNFFSQVESSQLCKLLLSLQHNKNKDF
jgi:DNA-binding MarR family transcriptional regulator